MNARESAKKILVLLALLKKYLKDNKKDKQRSVTKQKEKERRGIKKRKKIVN